MNNIHKLLKNLNKDDMMILEENLQDFICRCTPDCDTCPLYHPGDNTRCIEHFREWAYLESEESDE